MVRRPGTDDRHPVVTPPTRLVNSRAVRATWLAMRWAFRLVGSVAGEGDGDPSNRVGVVVQHERGHEREAEVTSPSSVA
ncbi:hypothetical protein [Streptomyces sp. NPDC056921]|uniref:hypothetical protein n=1 Tax=Streptomyces sp. NPDC056921 TaxID=3345966 RepID=UPI003631F2B4